MKLRPWQVAALLQVTRKTVQRYETRGLLPAVRDERGHRWFEPAAVEEFLRRHRDGELPARRYWFGQYNRGRTKPAFDPLADDEL